MNELINYDDNVTINTLKQTVAQGATEAEFLMFCQFCKSTGLNPFKKEIWFIKAGSRVQMMTGINGFLAIANSHSQFDGMEVDVEVNQQGAPLKATAKVYRKDRKYPSVGVALMSEFRKDTPIWKQLPSVMLTKVAKSIAIREAFPQELNGLYTEEEMPAEYAVPKLLKVADELPPPPKMEEERDYFYDLSLLADEEAQVKAEKFCKDKGLEKVDIMVYKSTKEISKLSNCLADL